MRYRPTIAISQAIQSIPVEPDLIVQNHTIKTRRERDHWLVEQNKLALEKGMHFSRYSYDEVRRLNLIEFWKECPKNEGEPRYTDVPGQEYRTGNQPAPWSEDKF